MSLFCGQKYEMNFGHIFSFAWTTFYIFFCLKYWYIQTSNLFYINIILPPNWLCLPSNIWTNKQLWNEFPFQKRYWIIGINGIYQVSVLVDLSSLLWQLWRWNTEWDLTYLETYSDLFGNLFWLIWKPITTNQGDCSYIGQFGRYPEHATLSLSSRIWKNF